MMPPGKPARGSDSDGAMAFKVRRANDLSEDLPPCDAARRMTVARYDRRTFKTPEEHDAKFPQRPWLSEGIQHDTWEGGIRRRCDERAWVLDATLGELTTLAMVYGELTIEPPNGPAAPFTLVLGAER